MKHLVKLRQLTNVSNDKSDISFKLTFPVHSSGSRLFLEFLEKKKQHFRENPAFSVATEVPDDSCIETDLFVIRINWIREIALECYEYIKQNII